MMAAVVLFIMAIQDYKTMEVTTDLQIILFFSIIIEHKLDPVLGLISIILLLSYRWYQDHYQVKIGGADIKIFASLILLGLGVFVHIIFWASLIALLAYLFIKQKKIPFVPFIWIGYVIVNI